MGNAKTTGQDFIDYYEKKQKDTGKTSMGEKLKYTKEKSKLRNQKLKEAMNN